MARGFRMRTGIILTLLLALIMTAAGCSGKPANGDSASGSGTPAQELRIAIPSEGDTLDPATLSLVTSFAVATNVYSGLVRYKVGTIDIEPDLATKWETSTDALTWTFFLRPDVKWQKGYGTLTAQDIVDSFDRIMDPKTASRWKGELADVDKVEAKDANTVVFKLKKPNAAFLHTIVAFRQGLITKKEAVAKAGTDYGRNPVGTGPFELEKWTPNTEVVLKANDQFYGGKPKLRKITFVVIADENVRMMALQKGEVDVAMSLTNPEIRKQLAADAKIDLAEIAAPSVHGLTLNTRSKPLDNLKVRQALYMAIDRKSIAEVIMGGLAEPASSELAPALLGHTKDVPKYEFNPQKAKQLLAEAGYPNGFETTIFFLNTTSKEILDTIQSNWKAIGVNLKANMVDGGAWVKAMGQGEAPVVWFAATRSDPNVFYQTFLHSKAFKPGLNASWYAGADKLIDAGGAESDLAKRKDAYAKVQQQVMTDLPFLPLYWPKHAHPSWKYVEGWGGRQNYDAYAFGVSIGKK